MIDIAKLGEAKALRLPRRRTSMQTPDRAVRFAKASAGAGTLARAFQHSLLNLAAIAATAVPLARQAYRQSKPGALTYGSQLPGFGESAQRFLRDQFPPSCVSMAAAAPNSEVGNSPMSRDPIPAALWKTV